MTWTKEEKERIEAAITPNRVIDESKRLIYCPVCNTPIEMDDICEVCNWQNTGPYNIDGGPNKMTLKEAKKAWVEGKPIR